MTWTRYAYRTTFAILAGTHLAFLLLGVRDGMTWRAVFAGAVLFIALDGWLSTIREKG